MVIFMRKQLFYLIGFLALIVLTIAGFIISVYGFTSSPTQSGQIVNPQPSGPTVGQTCPVGSVYNTRSSTCLVTESSGQHSNPAANTNIAVAYGGACIASNQCSSQACINGYCAECSTNLQCSDGYICGNHRCVAVGS